MGYFAEFTGDLDVTPPLTDRETELVEDVFGYEVADEGTVITIKDTNKPSAAVEGMEDLLAVLARGEASRIYSDTARYLTTPPTLHVISGLVGYVGEDGDTGEVTIQNSRLAVDW